MKVIITVLLLLGCAISNNLALPATSKDDVRDDVELLPPEIKSPYGDQPIVDTGAVEFGGGFSNPFGGLFENIEGIMTRMRHQMETLLKRFNASSNSTADFPDISTGGFAAISPFEDVDLSKGNTTSVTKIIDGHKVVINETEYKKEDDFGGAFFKVRIVDVKPNSEETTDKDVDTIGLLGTATPVTPGKDVESVENSHENEIPVCKEVEIANGQNTETTVKDVDFIGLQGAGTPVTPGKDVESVEHSDENEIPLCTEVEIANGQNTETIVKDVDLIGLQGAATPVTPGKDVESDENEIPLCTEVEMANGLNTETNGNDLDTISLLGAAQPVIPGKDVESVDNSHENEIPIGKEDHLPPNYQNVETFDEVDRDSFGSSFKRNRWNPCHLLGRFDSEDVGTLENSIDYQPPDRFHPIDLSGDIYVNQILEEAGATTNPDAEVFDVGGRIVRQTEDETIVPKRRR